jgi:hypothetical protein
LIWKILQVEMEHKILPYRCCAIMVSEPGVIQLEPAEASTA